MVKRLLNKLERSWGVKNMQGKELETTLFEIIAGVGSARSLYIEAIQVARGKDMDKANQLLKEGQDAFDKGHRFHADLMRDVSSDEHEQVLKSDAWVMLLMHAEDQLMSAEAFGILAEEFISLYQIMLDKGVL